MATDFEDPPTCITSHLSTDQGKVASVVALKFPLALT
jgi:hypothetical protein